jgi:hypothetical protein
VERSRRDAHRLLGVHTPIDTAVNHAVAARRRRTHASERTVARRPVRDGDVHGLAEMPCERSCRGDIVARQPLISTSSAPARQPVTPRAAVGDASRL